MALRENPGLVGALIGLCLGVLHYIVVLGIIGAAVDREAKRDPKTVDYAGFGARMRKIRFALVVAALGVLPAIGYAAGRALGK